jgi:hypothetical protein
MDGRREVLDSIGHVHCGQLADRGCRSVPWYGVELHLESGSVFSRHVRGARAALDLVCEYWQLIVSQAAGRLEVA